MPRHFRFRLGDTQPTISGFVPKVDLSTGSPTLTCVLENLRDGTSPYTGSGQTATAIAASAKGTTLQWTPPTAWAATGEFIGWFIGVKSSQTYRSEAFFVTVGAVDRTPSTHPYIYTDGRGGYASATDVQILIRNSDAFSDKTNLELIETLLGDTAEELDRALEQMYTMPLSRTTSPKAASYVRIINKYWALAELFNLLIPTAEEAGSAAMVYREKGAQMIDDLIEGSVILPDAPNAGGVPASSAISSADISDELDPDVDAYNIPIFSVDSFQQNGRVF